MAKSKDSMNPADITLATEMNAYHHRAMLSPESLAEALNLKIGLVSQRLRRFVDKGWAEAGFVNGQASGQYRLTPLGRDFLGQ